MITDEQELEQYAKLKQIDEFAKTLGITIYNIEFGFESNKKQYSMVIPCLNVEPEQLKNEPDLKGLASAL